MSPDVWQQDSGKRAGPRSHIPFPVTLHSPEEGAELPATIRNLSARGICLLAASVLQPQAEFELTVLIPYEISLTQFIPVRLKAQVLRSSVEAGEGFAIAALFPSEKSAPRPAMAIA